MQRSGEDKRNYSKNSGVEIREGVTAVCIATTEFNNSVTEQSLESANAAERVPKRMLDGVQASQRCRGRCDQRR
jgi:hypothetical protein